MPAKRSPKRAKVAKRDYDGIFDAATDDAAVARFLHFLSINTVSSDGPKGGYNEAADFIEAFAEKLGLPVQRVSYAEGKPVVIVKWEGQDSTLPAVLLNSHYDVVPAVVAHWKTEPFKAVVDTDGTIFARGTQDMKSVCMQYIEAIYRLKAAHEKSPFLRTIYLSFVPDEEIGGTDGASRLVNDELFARMNVGVALDEGLASPSDAFIVFYGERAAWWFSVKATGNTGHGSRFIPDTAAQKLVNFINKALQYRREQAELLNSGCAHGVTKLGDVVTLNLTALKAGVSGPELFGGYALNVIPHEAMAGFDVRIPPSIPLDDVKTMLESWAASEPGVTIDYHLTTKEHHVTSTDPDKNHWWAVFSKIMDENKWKIEPEVFPAATDSRYLRQLGIPCFGFSPMNNTTVLMHDHNESLHRDIFLRGIGMYEKVIAALANAAPAVASVPAATSS